MRRSERPALIGPGAGTGPETRGKALDILKAGKSAVLDADEGRLILRPDAEVRQVYTRALEARTARQATTTSSTSPLSSMKTAPKTMPRQTTWTSSPPNKVHSPPHGSPAPRRASDFFNPKPHLTRSQNHG